MAQLKNMRKGELLRLLKELKPESSLLTVGVYAVSKNELLCELTGYESHEFSPDPQPKAIKVSGDVLQWRRYDVILGWLNLLLWDALNGAGFYSVETLHQSMLIMADELSRVDGLDQYFYL